MKATRLIIIVAALASVLALSACAQSTPANASSTNNGSLQPSAPAGESAPPSATASKQVTMPDKVGIVTADDVANLENGAFLVDTRTPEEFAKGHIPGSLNASYPKSTGGPCQTGENAAAFRAAWAKLDVPQDAHVVLYCRTGIRATAASSALIEDGYANVDVYEGSWTDWTSDPSRPIET